MTLPIIPSILTAGKALVGKLRPFGEPFEEGFLSEQDSAAAAAAATSGDTLDIVKRLEGELRAKLPDGGAQAPIQPQPQMQPQQPQEGGGMVDAAGALGEARPRKQFAQPQIPDLVSNLLAGRQIAEAPETVQTLNGVRETGITGEAREIPDGVAAEAPGMLERFGEGAKRLSDELATNPVLQDLIGQVAQALSAREPQSFPHQLATGIRESAQGRQQDIMRQQMLDRLAGREPDDRIDPNLMTLSPELRQRAQLGALAEVGAAADIQRSLAGIPTGQERAAEFELTQAQIDATTALATQRDLETMQILTSTGVGQQFDGTQLSLLRLINDTANKIAAQAGGIQGVIQDPSGNTTFQFKNPEKYTKVFNETRDTIINNMINSGALPENARLLSTRSQTDANVPTPNVQTLDKTTQPPDSVTKDRRLPRGAKYIGSRTDDGKTLYFFDTTNDGIPDTAVRK